MWRSGNPLTPEFGRSATTDGQSNTNRVGWQGARAMRSRAWSGAHPQEAGRRQTRVRLTHWSARWHDPHRHHLVTGAKLERALAAAEHRLRSHKWCLQCEDDNLPRAAADLCAKVTRKRYEICLLASSASAHYTTDIRLGELAPTPSQTHKRRPSKRSRLWNNLPVTSMTT